MKQTTLPELVRYYNGANKERIILATLGLFETCWIICDYKKDYEMKPWQNYDMLYNFIVGNDNK